MHWRRLFLKATRLCASKLVCVAGGTITIAGAGALVTGSTGSTGGTCGVYGAYHSTVIAADPFIGHLWIFGWLVQHSTSHTHAAKSQCKREQY